jgi:hypothetical protein
LHSQEHLHEGPSQCTAAPTETPTWSGMASA